MYTYLYFLYLRVYPFLNYYRVMLHLLYTVGLCYQLLHNLNRLSIQFEILIANLDEDPQTVERIITRNIISALARRMNVELQDLHGIELAEGEIEGISSESDNDQESSQDLHDPVVP